MVNRFKYIAAVRIFSIAEDTNGNIECILFFPNVSQSRKARAFCLFYVVDQT